MGRKIIITAGALGAEAELGDLRWAEALAAALPIHAHANVWGGEIC